MRELTTKRSSFLFYAFSVFENNWAAEKGPGNVFQTFGITSLCLLATCIPMCKFIVRRYFERKHRYANSGLDMLGKRNRRVIHALWERFGI
jgi:uncharacterized membrane protein YhaH (DUF805 family)